MITKEAIRERILELGADVCGFGGMERFTQAPEGFAPTDLYADCKSVISIGIALPKGLLCVDSRLIYGHFNADVVHKVDEVVFASARFIEKECGGICVPIPSDGPYEYWEAESLTGKGLLSMKHAFTLHFKFFQCINICDEFIHLHRLLRRLSTREVHPEALVSVINELFSERQHH